MKRHFTLEDISFDEYNTLCKGLGLLVDNSPFSTNKRYMRGHPKRYTKLKEKRTYNELSAVIHEIEEDVYTQNGHQRISMAYPKPFLLRFSTIKKYLRENPANYFEKLLQFEENISELVIDLEKGKKCNPFYRDSFTFVKEDNLWVLRKLVVHKPNYGFYIFEGLNVAPLEGYYSLKCVLPR